MHIISNLSIGGAQVLLLDILSALKDLMDITVITIDSGAYMEKFSQKGIKVIDLKLKGLINPLIFLKLYIELKKLKPDVVHTHLLKADFYGRLCAKFLGTKLIYSTCHNDSTSHSVVKNDKISLLDKIDNLIIKFTGSYIIAISEKVRQYLIKRNFFDISGKIITVYNGVDIKKEEYILKDLSLEDFRNNLNITREDFLIVLVGRLEEQKGYLKFLSTILDVVHEQNLKMLIIGEGSQRSDIERFIENNNLKNNVYLLGFHFNTELYYEIADLVAVPSIWEGFGIVVCEAMIKQKIVLASNVGGIPEIIDDEVNGFLYNVKDEEELRIKLKYIIKNYEKLREIRLNGVNKVKEKFDISKNSYKYYKSYISHLNKN